MATKTVTMFEARNLVERLDWKISNIHTKISNLLYRPESVVETAEQDRPREEVKTIETEYPKITESLDQLEARLDDLYLEKVTIERAMREAEVTLTFTYKE